jgi:hypothetical protein
VIAYVGSSIGSVFRRIDEAEGIRSVDAAVDQGVGLALAESGIEVIPIVQYADIASDSVLAKLVQKMKARGACVIHGAFTKAWNEPVGRYLEENHLDQKLANAAEDKYFGALASAR